jgi:CBS domain-containing protein
VMIPDPYVVSAETALDLVLEHMAECHYGSALVCDRNGQVIGIFTAPDALRAYAAELRKHHSSHARAA